ncbi:MAG: ketoacyl-ACP synthase III [Lachnospiraceae bacterium]|nr:ketoacyl-ACP synthase III [Lachnospiraceae bacterium]
MQIRIIGTGSYVPEKALDNQALERMVDTSDAWIRERTGIGSRRITQTGTTDMAIRAARRAMEMAGLSPEELDLIVVGTSTGDCLFPNTACEVQAALGAKEAACFDLSAACSGFLFSLNTACVYLESGVYRTALVIGTDSLSKTVDWSDRGTCILFGDGAGAAVLKKEESVSRVGPFLMKADGNRGEVLRCMGTPLRNPFIKEETDAKESVMGETGEQKSEENETDFGYLSMNGQEVFRFAVKTVPEVLEELLWRAGVSAEEIQYFVLHQANERIIGSVAKRMKQPLSKFPMNLEHYGNTSGASIPILLDELNREGRLRKGDKLALAGFGAGLTWGATFLVW